MSILERCQALLEARNRSELERALASAAEALGCQWFGGYLAILQTEKLPYEASSCIRRISFGRVPPKYVGYTNAEAAKRDPVIARCRRRLGLPQVWSRNDYEAADQADLWDEMASAEMCRGYATMTFLTHKRALAFGIEAPDAQVLSDKELGAQLAGFSLLTAHLGVALENVFEDTAPRESPNPLSARQREVLQWTSKGKTAWEIGQIMSLSESTVHQHISAAARQLNAPNKVAAAATAASAGWL